MSVSFTGCGHACVCALYLVGRWTVGTFGMLVNQLVGFASAGVGELVSDFGALVD